MDEEEIISQLQANFTAISRMESLKEVYSTISYVFKLLAKLRLLNEPLSQALLGIATNISSSSDIGAIHNSAQEALVLLTPTKRLEGVYLDFDYTVESPGFVSDRRKYTHIHEQIQSTQNAIETSQSYVKKLHEFIKRGRYAGCRHARLTKNLRIIYTIDSEQKKLIYICIITKNDFDNSTKAKPIDWIKKYKNL